MKLLLLVLVALCAFAANSLLCRAALSDASIDPYNFTIVRLLSGAILLYVVDWVTSVRKESTETTSKVPWTMSIALFAYAIFFSLAYISLGAATGALALFGSVQITMVAYSRYRGETTSKPQWIGFLLANVGLVYLFLPGIEAPAPIGLALMCASGCAWGIYSALGRGVSQPIAATSLNFRRSLLFTIPLCLVAASKLPLESQGLTLAIVSGAITSGLGYVIWYRALPELTTLQAAIAQLSVPLIAAIGGFLFLQESLTLRLAIASLLILGGIALPFFFPTKPRRREAHS